MITKEQLLKIREYISCPQFGDKTYGIWGALRIEQREAYLQLIETIEFLVVERDKLSEELLEPGDSKTEIIKFEAYREFADKIKEKHLEVSVTFGHRKDYLKDVVTVDEIDNTLEEFLEGMKNG